MSGCNGSSIPTIEQYVIDQFSQTGRVEAENLEASISFDAETRAKELALDINDDGVVNGSVELTHWNEDKFGWLDKKELKDLIGDKPAMGRISVLSDQIPTITEADKKEDAIYELAKFGERAQSATPQLINELADRSAVDTVAVTLYQINPHEDADKALLTAFRSNENVAVRAGAAKILTGSSGAHPVLIHAYLSDKTPHEVKVAINAGLIKITIDETSRPNFMAKVYAEFSNPAENLVYRVNSGKAFVRLVGPEDAKTYLQSLAAIAKNPKEETEVRVIAIKALAQMGEAAKPITWVLADLAKLQKSKDSNQQAIGLAAQVALQKINANALRLQEAMAQDPAMAGSICLE